MIPLITFDNVPETAVINGIVYPIKYGYRSMMAVEIEMFREISDEQKLLNALNIFYAQNIPPDIQKAVDYMLWFHRCGGEIRKKSAGGRASPGRAYCFQQDAPLIYAAFRQQYQLDLRRTLDKELHWWEFMAMFEALDDNVKMAKVMHWRTCSLDGMSKEHKKFIKEMRSRYALKDPESTMDSKAKLAKRNADMKAYVKKRMEESRKNKMPRGAFPEVSPEVR